MPHIANTTLVIGGAAGLSAIVVFAAIVALVLLRNAHKRTLRMFKDCRDLAILRFDLEQLLPVTRCPRFTKPSPVAALEAYKKAEEHYEAGCKLWSQGDIAGANRKGREGQKEIKHCRKLLAAN